MIRYEGPDSTNPFAFKYYDPERVVMGKKMKDQLPFAMAWWHNLCANGGLPVGINFDSKNRRPSNTHEDMFHAFILGMDSFAFGLLKAAQIIEDGRIEGYTEEKYSSFDSDLGKRIRKGETTLAELVTRAALLKRVDTPISGKQEYLEGVLNNIILSGK